MLQHDLSRLGNQVLHAMGLLGSMTVGISSIREELLDAGFAEPAGDRMRIPQPGRAYLSIGEHGNERPNRLGANHS